jgi:hypothetical protein
MHNRYPHSPVCGLRLDEDKNQSGGKALDAGLIRLVRNPQMSLWIRNAADEHLEIQLNLDDVKALRDYCSYLLVEVGQEKYAQVVVPNDN